MVTYAFLFGLFQMGMPLIGYAAGRAFSDTISYLDHWVALVLLGFIGGKMIWESIKEMREGDSCPVEKQLTLRMMLMQAVATSIDALAVGVGFAVMKVNIWAATASIGIITFGCSLAGTWLGRKFGMILGRVRRNLRRRHPGHHRLENFHRAHVFLLTSVPLAP